MRRFALPTFTLVLVTCLAACAPQQPRPIVPSPVALNEIRALDGGTIDTPPQLVAYTPPEYPAQAVFEGLSGSIALRVEVDEQGRVGDIHVVRSLPIFDIAAIEAMQRWRFSPALRAGRPVAFSLTVPFTFRL